MNTERLKTIAEWGKHTKDKVRRSTTEQMSGEMKEQLVWSHRAVWVNRTWIIVPEHNTWSQSWKLESPEVISPPRIWYTPFLFQRTHGLFGLGPRRWALPVVMSEHGAVTVAEVQTPDLHVPVGGASGDERAILLTQDQRPWAKTVGQHHLTSEKVS